MLKVAETKPLHRRCNPLDRVDLVVDQDAVAETKPLHRRCNSGETSTTWPTSSTLQKPSPCTGVAIAVILTSFRDAT